MKSVGFNTVRISFSNQMLRSSATTSGISFSLNPDLRGLSPLQCLDKIVQYSAEISLRVILSRQSSLADAGSNEVSWYLPGDPYYTEARVISDWTMLAERYAGSAVLAADLWNAPRGVATWGAHNRSTDWNQAAERIGNAVLAANPYWLIVVQGLHYGYDLEGIAAAPVTLAVPHRLVYGIQEYSNDVFDHPSFSSPEFPNNLRGIWNENFGFVVLQQIAPLFITEFGTSFAHASDEPWLKQWLRYMEGEYLADGASYLPPGHLGLSWSYQQVAPYGPVGGILDLDWQTIQSSKTAFLQPIMAPLFQPADPSGPYKPPANVSWVHPSPSAPSTVAPTGHTYEYYHTSGNQIVNSRGQPVRLAGVNWYLPPQPFIHSFIHFLVIT